MTRWLVLGLVVSACAGEGREVVEVGVVDPDTYPVQVPARVAVGEQATITVVSYGDGCTAFESTDVQQTETGLDITPYDTRTRGVCDDAAYPIEHPAAVTFAAPGTKTIRVHGWKFSPTDRAQGTAPVPVDFEYSILVE
jgi:hypothetical protein